ncbi:MAG: hypothetical protein KJ574_02605, partial [Nanoarchaeota archaeon]|nr:hypothetical protein [Nanoarchaeota archaeon]
PLNNIRKHLMKMAQERYPNIVDIIEETKMEKARALLRHAEEHGIDRQIWHVNHWRNDDIPLRTRGFMEDFLAVNLEHRDKDESPERYVVRLIKRGHCFQFDGYLYVVHNSLGLNFRIAGEYIRTLRRKVKFHTSDVTGVISPPLEDEILQAMITVRYHNMKLVYRGWDKSANLPPKENGIPQAKPNTVIFNI